MKRILKIIIFLFPLLVSAQELDRGEFGAFKKSLNNKDYAYKIINDPTGISPAKKVESFELRNGDCYRNAWWDDCKNDRERVELIERNESRTLKQTVWYGWSFYLDKNFPSIYPVKLSLAQFYDDGALQPVWMFQVDDKGLYVERMMKSGKKVLEHIIPITELKGKWQTLEVEVKWSTKEDGFLNVWVNNQQKLAYKGSTVISDKFYFKYGLYRTFLSRFKNNANLPTQHIYFANVKMGKTQKNILP